MSKIRILALVLVATTALTLPALACAASLSGLVTTPDGSAVASVWLVVSKDGSEVKRSLTGDDGRYYLDGLAAGSYKVTVEQRGKAVHHGQASLPKADSRVTMDVRLR
jgi:hypothetical protein